MRRAVAFCQVIERAKEGKVHKVSSKQIAGMFQSVVEAYQEQEEFETEARLICEAEHVDGSMNASEKEAKLVWLKEPSPDHTCRISEQCALSLRRGGCPGSGCGTVPDPAQFPGGCGAVGGACDA
ncbi:MAG: hypothetical protein JVY19_04485 [Ferrovum myxofaciens]|nr:hypothetical protein [Ferrovum myxofaciens]QWY75693.1 MAG: hypothetical protein JVY19_04485 [Ferrovum myxofaciens]